MVLTDAPWAVLEPLIEACRPQAKVPPSPSAADDQRDPLAARQWREMAIAARTRFGPWWMAAQIFIRWSRLGVWERLLLLVQESGISLGMTFLDGTCVRAHQKAAGAAAKRASAQDGVRVRRLGALVVAMAPRPA